MSHRDQVTVEQARLRMAKYPTPPAPPYNTTTHRYLVPASPRYRIAPGTALSLRAVRGDLASGAR